MIGRIKSVGIGGKPLKTARHHWWPRGLSELWEDAEGRVTRLSWEGKSLRAPPKEFGAITNAHLVNLKGPWATSIEPLFDDADSALPGLVKKLEQLPYMAGKDGIGFEKRITPHSITTQNRKLLGEGLASLLVRCPSHRNMLHLTTERYNGRTGDRVRKHDDTLIALNIHQHYRQLVGSLEKGGKIVILRADEHEFIMGEGYLSTLVGLTIQLEYRCLLPLTPTLAILAFSPFRCWTDPPICTIGLTREEVDHINDVTQIYTRDYIYYRGKSPKVIDSFRLHQFQVLQFHSFPWLDTLMEAVASFLPGPQHC
jgi:hypothetical protein